MKSVRRTRLALGLLITLIVTTIQMVPASAGLVTLYQVRGHILDPLGRPLDQATVYDDRGHWDVTDATGAYALPEEDLGQVTVTATRADLATSSQTITVNIPLDQTMDFQLLYLSSLSLDARYISTALEGKAIAAEVVTTAPSPGLDGVCCTFG